MSKIAELMEEVNNKIENLLGIDICEDTGCIPYLGDLVEISNFFVTSINKKKLFDAWKGIAKDENIEKCVNEVYNFINNENRAFYVAECFRKIAWSNSKIAATIIGIMLGEIKEQDRDFCNDDLILLDALEHMTDFDIRNFKQLLEGNYINDDIGKKYFDTVLFPKDKKDEYLQVLEFGEKYRLFSIITNSTEDDNFFFGTEYIPKEISYKLLEYIQSVSQIINYEF